MALKSFLRALGVGGPEIDAVLDNDRVQPGGVITGTLHIRGGDADKTASHAIIEIAARITRKQGDNEVQVDEAINGVRFPGPIRLGQTHAIPFRVDVPAHTPITTYGGRNFVWLRSGLDVPWAVDPSDSDRLEIVPTHEQANVIAAMESLGFRLYKVDIEPRSAWQGRRWVQEFEFRPSGHGNYRFDEIEIVFEGQHGSQVDVMVQIDRAARGLGGFLIEMTGTDESWRRGMIDASSVQAAAASLQRVIG